MVKFIWQIGAVVLLAGGAGTMGNSQPTGTRKDLIGVEFDRGAPTGEVTVRRSVVARLLSEAPRVDGRPDDRAWREAAVLGPLNRIGTAKPAPVETRVSVGHFDGVLYVALQCDEPEAARGRGGDAVEILLDPRHERRAAFAIIIASDGTMMDYLLDASNQKLDWDSQCIAVAAETDRGWAAEVAIMRTSLADPRNDIIGFNIARRRPGTEGKPFTWSPSGPSFERGDQLGNLCFETRPCSIQKVEVGWPHVGENRICIWLQNGADRDLRLLAGLSTSGPEGKADKSKYKIVLPAKKAGQYGFSHRISAAGVCDLAFVLADEESEQVIARFTRPGLEVAGVPLVMEPVAEAGDGRALHTRFRALLPEREVADVTFTVMLRKTGALDAIEKRAESGPRSGSGIIRIRTDELEAGEYSVDLYLSREGGVFAHVGREFSVPAKRIP